eukprot:Clim_evm209s157 gene=Clim_evmTU209s157
MSRLTRHLRYQVLGHQRPAVPALAVTVKRFLSTSVPHQENFDLVVIGSGPAAQKAAIDSAKRKKKVAVVDKGKWIGGVCVHTGTIPSKTFREAVLHLTGYRHQGFYGKWYQPVRNFTVEDILYRVGFVVKREFGIVRDQLRRNGIKVFTGVGSFTDTHTVEVLMDEEVNDNQQSAWGAEDLSAREVHEEGLRKAQLHGKNFLIATGTRPARRADVPYNGRSIIDSDELLSYNTQIPRDIIVAGAGVVGVEYASMLNIIPGSRVTIVDPRPQVLDFADREIMESLQHTMRQAGGRFLLGENIKNVECLPDELSRTGDRVNVYMESGKKIKGDALLWTMGRQGNTDKLGLENVGLTANKRGLLSVNEFYQTEVPHIYAAGDCIGFPALASCSMEQGRLVSCHMWGDNVKGITDFFPYGIYTIPEISMVGKTEQELTAGGQAYEVGIAKYEELARGQMLGGGFGFLKILFCPDTLKLLGVHAIGEGATEIIHIGQVALQMGATMKYLRDTVWNYPTLAEAYRVAALNGIQKL